MTVSLFFSLFFLPPSPPPPPHAHTPQSLLLFLPPPPPPPPHTQHTLKACNNGHICWSAMVISCIDKKKYIKKLITCRSHNLCSWKRERETSWLICLILFDKACRSGSSFGYVSIKKKEKKRGFIVFCKLKICLMYIVFCNLRICLMFLSFWFCSVWRYNSD